MWMPKEAPVGQASWSPVNAAVTGLLAQLAPASSAPCHPATVQLDRFGRLYQNSCCPYHGSRSHVFQCTTSGVCSCQYWPAEMVQILGLYEVMIGYQGDLDSLHVSVFKKA